LGKSTWSETHTEYLYTRNESCYQSNNCHSTDNCTSFVFIFCVHVVAYIVNLQ